MEASRTLLKARVEAGFTQRQLSELSGVTQPSIAAYERGRVVPTDLTLNRLLSACRPRPSQALARHRQAVLDLVASVGGRHARVFGSVARGTDRPGSDIDLLVQLPDDVGVFEVVGLEQQLEDLLGVRVDVVDDLGTGRVLEVARAQAVAL